MSFFGSTEQLPADPVLGVGLAYNADPMPVCQQSIKQTPDAVMKLNLGVGTYKDAEGRAYVMPVVEATERALVQERLPQGKEYLPIDGDAALRVAASKLMFGEAAYATIAQRTAAVQALSGTGAVRLVAELLNRQLPLERRVVYCSKPTWPNHPGIFLASGFRAANNYRYVNANHEFDEAAMTADIKAATPGSVVILQACPHNPTGVDPTPEQWERIVKAIAEVGLFAVVDSAYQGLASGDPSKDSGPVPALLASGVEFAVCQSFSKTLSLYCERVGVLYVVCKTPRDASAVLSQLKVIARAMHSNPPAHGARIAAKVLGTPELLVQWHSEIEKMVGRMQQMRTMLHGELVRLGTPGDWSCVTNQRGLFSLLPVTVEQVRKLREKWHVYMMDSGRINIAGLTELTVPYFAKALDDIVRSS